MGETSGHMGMLSILGLQGHDSVRSGDAYYIIY